MNWHYVNAGVSVGPISDADFDKLVQAGTIQPETLVWNETMSGWQPCSQARPGVAVPPALAFAGTGAAPGSAPASLACSQCGRVLPPENLVSLGGALVCAACKPLYLQKMREGLPAAPGATVMEYAGIWPRLAAKILDGLIFGFAAAIIIGVAAAVLVPLIAKNQNQAGIFILILVGLIAVVVFGISFYQIYCLPTYGGTPGKRIMNIKVVTADGGPISWGRAFGRFFAEMLNGFIPFWIGYIIAIFDAQKRTVHDHIAGTRVVVR